MQFKLREYRELAGLTQQEVADKLDISVSRYGSWEREDRQVNLREAAILADIFGCSLDALADYERPGQRDPVVLSNDEFIVIDAMRRVSPEGRARIVEDATLIAESPRYAKNEDGEDSGILTA